MADFSCDIAALDDVDLPESCVCCCGPADETVETSITPTEARAAVDMAMGASGEQLSIEFYYCSACLRHIRAHDQAWMLSLIPGGLVAILLLIAGGFPFTMSGGKVFLAILSGGAVMALARYLVMPRFFAAGGPACAPSPVAVACMGPYRDGRYRFHFANQRYGREFAKRNGQAPGGR